MKVAFVRECVRVNMVEPHEAAQLGERWAAEHLLRR